MPRTTDLPAILPVGIVLSAGAGRRMGGPKGLLQVGGAPLVRAWVDALAPWCAEVRVVIGAEMGAQLEALTGAAPTVTTVPNPNWETEDMAASLRRALERAPVPARVLISPVDVPPPPDRALRALLAAGPPAVLSHRGSPGHPALLTGACALEAVRQGTLRAATAGAIEVDTDFIGCTWNLNRPADLEAWLAATRGDEAGPPRAG